MSHSLGVVRKLWNVETVGVDEGDGWVHVSTVDKPHATRGIATDAECRQFISPSFVGALKDLLPLPLLKPAKVCFGGLWFWETYRHGLSGENVAVNLSGTCVNLREDTLDSQSKARVACMSLMHESSDTSNQLALPALLHSSAKLEVMLAIAMSVALHVTQQPLLEKNEGPQAVVLCSSKDQCAEFTYLLDKFCGELHLVTHNLFAPYPSIPSTKRADIVIGTPPLWENASSLERSAAECATDGGLEKIICQVTRNFVAPMYARTKWRPYSSKRVSQLVIFDLISQLRSGFGTMLKRWTAGVEGRLHHGAPLATDRRHAPPPWQFYVVYDQFGSQQEGEDETELHSFLEAVTALGKESCYGSSSVFYSARVPRKRVRENDTGALNDSIQRQDELPIALFVRHAISYARYLADPSTLAELRTGILEQCSAFWDSFDGLESGGDTDICTSVDVHLAFFCEAEEQLQDEASPPHQRVVLKEAGVLVRPTCLALQEKPSRAALLMRHIEERLTGTTYDGSTISCVAIGGSELPLRGFAFSPSGSLHPLLSVPSILSLNPVLLTPEEVTPAAAIAAEAAVLELTELRLNAFEDAMPAQTTTSTDFPPCAAILEEIAPADPFTVLVLRNVSRTVGEMCNCPPCSGATGESEPQKSYVQYVLEECCQYGKVISYFCYEDKTKRPPNSRVSSRSSVSRASSNEAADATTVGCNSPKATSSEATAALFIEFQSTSCALEATKVFAQRFALSSNLPHEQPRPRVAMMRNSAFYAGVAQEKHTPSDEDSLFDEAILAG